MSNIFFKLNYILESYVYIYQKKKNCEKKIYLYIKYKIKQDFYEKYYKTK